MKKQITAFMCAFTICICSIFSASLTARAADDLSGYADWTIQQKADYFFNHFGNLIFKTIGFIRNGDTESMCDAWLYNEYDGIRASDETYEEWLARNVGVETDEEGNSNMIISDELSDAMYQACMAYIDSVTTWYTVPTITKAELDVNKFSDASLYKWTLEKIDELCDDAGDVFWFTDTPRYNSGKTLKYLTGYLVDSNDGFQYVCGEKQTFNNGTTKIVPLIYDNNWGRPNKKQTYYYSDGTTLQTSYNLEGCGIQCYESIEGYIVNGTQFIAPLSRDGHTLRIFKTAEAMKSYDTGTRPYFVTDKFQDYDINGDNSCILSESELNGSSVYGDVVNYIINNYDDPNGLSEDDLIRIIEDLINRPGVGDGDDDDNSGGGGFLDFLDGLGGLFDGILSILGKLLEYIGKAITMIVDLIDNVINVIPASVGELFTAIFPFLPPEFFTAIELAMVLGVVCIVIKIFKG